MVGGQPVMERATGELMKREGTKECTCRPLLLQIVWYSILLGKGIKEQEKARRHTCRAHP